MKKFHLLVKISVFVITLVFLFTFCEREALVYKRHFKISLKTWYRVSPTAPSPVVVNGITYVSLANLVVGGNGTATSIGNIKSYANTLSYGTDLKAPPTGAIGAPVNEIPEYPNLGGPLPLIQTGDFVEVPVVISAFHIPTSVLGHTINLVVYDKKGDAIFLSNIPGTGTSTSVSPTVGGYSNKTLILGGAGKFKDAAGELDNKGFFSFIEPFEGEDNYEGWISY